jgi:site-specific DNA recombinase
MNGVIYCRVSSREQMAGTSLESQEAACHEYARSKNICVLRVFVEQGESAKFADRTELVELIDFCRESKGAVQVLLVWKVDRFARNVADHFSIKATLGKYGVHIVSVTEPIDANPEGKLMETILAGSAQFDNDIRAMRTVQGMRRKLQEGIYPWAPPLGYKSSVMNAEKKTQPDQIDPAVFGPLQKAWREYATGAHTQTEMRLLTQAWGLTTEAGNPFSPQMFSRLFTNPYYAGILKDPWNGEEHEGRHVPMVTRDEFVRVQRVISRRHHSVPHKKNNPEFPLRGLVRCDSCLHYLTGSFSTGRKQKYPYYVCHGPASCPKRQKSHPTRDIHHEFDVLLDRLSPKPELIRRLGDVIVKVAEEKLKNRQARRRIYQKHAAQLDRELAELIRMRAQSLISDQEFTNQKTRILNDRAAREGQETTSISIDEVRQQISDIAAPLTELRGTWRTLQPPIRRRFDRLVLPVGFVRGKSRTAQTGRLFGVLEAFGGSNSTEVAFPCPEWNPIVEEIQAFWKILKGMEDADPPPKRRFDNRHRRYTSGYKIEPHDRRT